MNQMNTAEQIKPAGIALFELGAEDESIWPLFSSRDSGPIADYSSLANPACNNEIFTDGPGPLYVANAQATAGRREIKVGADGRIVDAHFDVLPVCESLEGMTTKPGSIL